MTGAGSAQDEVDADIRRYVAQMGSRNAMVALDAVDYIPYFGSRAVPALIEGLREPQKVIGGETARLRAVVDAEIARQKDEEGRQRMLKYKEAGLPQFHAPNVKAFAAAALGRIPDARAVEPLIAALDDPDTYELNVLSDDGASLHPSYDAPQSLAVARHAAMALEAVTGRSHGLVDPATPGSAAAVRDRWKAWWEANRDSFTPAGPEGPGAPLAAAPDGAPFPVPDHARYLRGVKVCVDPGHGGDRWKRGYKRGPSGASEAEANLRTARFLRDFLAAAGAEVVMCRDSDADIPLMERPKIANRAGADLFVSIHHNWGPRYTTQAATIWHHADPDFQPANLDLARCLHEAVARVAAPADLHRAGGLMSDFLMYPGDGFGVLRGLDPSVTGVLVETAFYSNHEIERAMRSIDYNRRIAHACFLGLARYLYLGIPRAEAMELQPPPAGPVTTVKLRLRDGLEDRREWGGDRPRLLADSIRIRIDGHDVQHIYDPATGIATVTFAEPLAPGGHTATVRVMNVNKNHAWPKPVRFQVP
jgi:N-acetylmuramoyl-L-alanine amidase